jgi:hypothetical protein
MTRRTLLLAAALALFPGIVSADYWVAPNGDDVGLGTRENPFATLRRARDEIRKQKAAGALGQDATVFVHGGLYVLDDTLKLGPEDSGSAEGKVVYRACDGEKPTLIGGRLITGFQPHEGQVLKTNVNGQGLKGERFRQLFFDGRRQHLARFPNYDPANPYGGGWAYADGEPIPMYKDLPGESRRVLQYKTEDARRWARPQEGEVMVFPRYNWWNNLVPIASVDAQTRTITLSGDCSYPIRPTDRYYVCGLREELDAPGEWYLDSQSGDLFFWPPEPLANKPVYAPVLRSLIELQGASHVTFRGFTVECCNGTAVTLRDSQECLIAGCTIRNVGDYHGSGVSVEGGRHNGVVGNDIYEIGSNAIHLGGGDRVTLTPAENFADNNYIHHTGVFYKQGVGISLHGVGNRATHNLIHDCPRMGIMFSGNNLEIEYNHIRHINLETADTGAVYTGGRDWISSRGTKIRYNYFHDSLGFGNENGHWVSPHYSWGVYLDDNTGGVDVVGNIVARCIRGAIHLHNGRDNLVENNVFLDGTLQQIECNGWTPTHSYWTTHLPEMIKGFESVADQPAWKTMRNMQLHPTQAVLPDGTIMSGNVFQRNIVCYHAAQAKLYSVRQFSFGHNRSDENLFWHFGQPLLTGQSQIKGVVGPNLVANAGFEESPAGDLPKEWRWQSRPQAAKAEVDAMQHSEGQASLRIDSAVDTDDKGKPRRPIYTSRDIPATPGKTYKLTARMKASAEGLKAALGVQSYVANVYFWYKNTPATLATDWKPVELVFKLPGPGEKDYKPEMTGLVVRLDAEAESGSIWIDDVTLHEAEPLDEWVSWQQLGMDRRSVVADPMFVDPDKDDYRLRPESPAWKLGFQAIPVEKIGPYADPLRASWPIREAEGAREKPMR